MLDSLLGMDCIVEMWHRKDTVRGNRRSISYDLRVVWQFGHIAYLVARGSAGPVTNLHLNNHVLPVQFLGLSDRTLLEIEKVCRDAVGCFEGIRVAGIDVMLERKSRFPRVIEMNGQGDLIYQDIYDRNLIYTEQVRWMREAEHRNMSGGL